MDNSTKIKNVLANQIMDGLNQKEIMGMVKKGFKGYDNMSLEEITNIFVDKFGWDGYGVAVSKLSKPKAKKYIAYFDASYMPETKEGYISYVIKTDDNELVIRDGFKVSIKDIYVGESLALLRLLDTALKMNIDNLTVYGDNQGVINKVNRRKGGHKGWNGYFPSIANKMDKFNRISVKWNNRDENRYADMLCRLVRRGANITKTGGQFDLEELLQLSAKVG